MNLIQAFRSWLIDDDGKLQGYQHIPNGQQTRVVTDNSSSDVVGIVDGLVIDKASGKGIKVDTATPTFGWRDLEGPIFAPMTGANKPTLTTYIGGSVEDYAFAAGDHYGPIKFHIPHDYVPGSNLHIHTHWSHNGTDVSGSFVLNHYVTYAKGHNQSPFHAEKNLTLTVSSLNITNTPRYQHRIDEIQLSTSGGSASLLNTDIIEPDGLILLHFDATTVPTVTAGSTFIHYVDVHYQSTSIGTKQKSPDFYT